MKTIEILTMVAVLKVMTQRRTKMTITLELKE
jgi:hypothetical protein